jgi:serine/threonine protein kinase
MKLKLLGEGAYSSVYKIGKDKALKIIRMDEEFSYCTMRELEILQNIKHENLLQVYEINKVQNSFFVKLPLIKNKLSNIIHKNINLSTIIEISYQLIDTIRYLHSLGVVHRDIKQDNILVDVQNRKVYVIDFSLSKIVYESLDLNSKDSNLNTHSSRVNIVDYRPPELVLLSSKKNEYEVYDPFKVDAWSLGCILLEFTRDVDLFIGYTKYQIYHQQEKFFSQDINNYVKDFYKKDELYPNFINLIKNMLKKDAKERISLKEAIGFEVFEELSKEKVDELFEECSQEQLSKEQLSTKRYPIKISLRNNFLIKIINIFCKRFDQFVINRREAFSKSLELFQKISGLGGIRRSNKFIACFCIYLKMFHSIIYPMSYFVKEKKLKIYEPKIKIIELKIFKYLNYKIFLN